METKLHIAMFPWLAFGHIIPFLNLSKFFVKKGHRVSFISTPRNIDRLPQLPSEYASSITLVKLPLPHVDGLPSNAEATMDISNHDIPFLKKAYDGLEQELSLFLRDSHPDWIIHDFASYWLPPVAATLGIHKAFYSIINAWFLAFLGRVDGPDPRTKPEDFTVVPEWVPFETKAAYKLYESHWIVGAYKENVSGISDANRSVITIKGTDAIIVRHCNEFEGQWLKLLEDLYHKSVIPTGLMPPPVPNDSSRGHGNTSSESWVSVKEWLDTHSKGSVVYVALGTEVSLSEAQINELALGLELSWVPFFWALRKSSSNQQNTNTIDYQLLADGFEERVKGRGIVWKTWAPQLKILSHESVGGFLTHCGWSSCIEGLMFGHPLIMLPFLVDQGLNARVLEDKQVGLEIQRDEQDGSYTRNSVAESVRMVMNHDGNKIRAKAKEMSKIFGDKELHDGYLEDLIKYLETKKPSTAISQ